MSDRTVTFSELASENLLEFGAGRPRSVLSDQYLSLPILRVADVLDGRIESSFQGYVPNSCREAVGPKISKPGDVVLTAKGTVGRVALMPSDGPAFAYSPQLCYFRPAANGPLRRRYLYYWFKSADFWNQADALKGQTDMADYLSLADIHSLKIRIPSLDQQADVVNVLGSLDDKIAVNDRIVNSSSSIRQALYACAVQEGGSEIHLEDVAVFHNRLRKPLSSRDRSAFQGVYPYYGANGVVDSVGNFIFDGSYLLVGEDGTVVTKSGSPIVHVAHGKFWVSNHAHVLAGMNISNELLHEALSVADIRPLITGAVQPKVSMGSLKKLPLVLPSAARRVALEQKLAHFEKMARLKISENCALSELRDALLPRLMSGEIKLRDAEIVAKGLV